MYVMLNSSSREREHLCAVKQQRHRVQHLRAVKQQQRRV